MSKATRNLRRDTLEKVAGSADRIMKDVSLADFRRPGARKALAVALLAASASTAFTAAMDGPWALLNPVTVLVLAFLLRHVNRGFVDFPDEFVDERIRMRRNETFRLSYVSLAGVLSLVLFYTLLAPLLPVAGPQPSTFSNALATFWIAMSLPSAIFAWREPYL